jgi:hypothetical protein
MKGLLWIGVATLTWTAHADGLRDPTRPPLSVHHAAVPQESAPILSAVLNFNGQRSAIFNGRLVHSGSAIGGYTILAVLEDGVRFRHAGQSEELHMPHPTSSIKKPAVDVLRASSGVP